MRVTGHNMLIFLLMGFYLPVHGQNDTVKAPLTKSLDYEFLNEKFKERKSMLYIAGRAGLSDPNGVMVNDNGFYVGYERKFRKVHLVGAGTGFFLQDNSHIMGFDKLLRINLSYKWLYNLEYRMERGRTGNNLSANYFTISPTLTLGRSSHYISGYAWDFTRGEWAVKYKSNSSVSLGLKIGYGLQRTIRDRILFDIQAGIFVKRRTYTTPGEFFYGQITAGYIIK